MGFPLLPQQEPEEHRKEHRRHRPASHRAGPEPQAQASPAPRRVVQRHAAQGEAAVLGKKPYISVQGNPEPSVAQHKEQGPGHRGVPGTSLLPAQGADVPYARQGNGQGDPPIRRPLPENRRERKHQHRRKRREAHVVLPFIDGQLQPGVVPSQVQPPLQPRKGLEGVGVVAVLLPRPHPREGSQHRHGAENAQPCRQEHQPPLPVFRLPLLFPCHPDSSLLFSRDHSSRSSISSMRSSTSSSSSSQSS